MLERVGEWVRQGHHSRIITAINVSKLALMERDVRARAAILRSDLTIADGVPIILALRLLGEPIPERITGVGLMFDLLRLADRERWSVYFLGARPEVIEAVARTCAREYPGARVLGARDGYFDRRTEGAVVTEIARQAPDILFLGLGLPQKEYFLGDHQRALNCGVVLPVGGGLDVLAGRKERAPAWVQRLGAEWLWRSVYDRSRARLVLRSSLPFLRIVVHEGQRRRRHADSR